MVNHLPKIEKAGGGALNAVREHFGIIFKTYNGSPIALSSHEARLFAIEVLLLCEQADAAYIYAERNRICGTTEKTK